MYAACLGVMPLLQSHTGADSLNGRQVSIPASCFGVDWFFRGSVYTAHMGSDAIINSLSARTLRQGLH